MGYNPANFAYHIGTGPWVEGYTVCYAVSFCDGRTGRESPRSEWWGPKTDPKQLYGGFGLIRIPVDPLAKRRRDAFGAGSTDNPSGSFTSSQTT
jgi:hypothetical protein